MEKKCSICGSESTSVEKSKYKSRKTGVVTEKSYAHWYGTKEKPICKKCFVRNITSDKNKVPDDTKCEQCGTNETRMTEYNTPCWKKTDTGYICWSCHITNVNKTRVLSPEALERMAKAQIGRKHTDESKHKMSESRTGAKNHFFNKQHTDESKEKMSVAHRGDKNPFWGTKRPEHAERMRGENAPNWKGGIWTNKIKPLTYEIRRTQKYIHWRLSVFSRDNYTCQVCGDSRGHNLEAHHIQPMVLILSENEISTVEQAEACEALWDVSNGLTLCIICHRIEEDGRREQG